jgi:hypothetical protein
MSKTKNKTAKNSEPNLDAPNSGTPEAGSKENPLRVDGGALVVEKGPPKGFKFTPSERPVEELVKEKCEFAEGHVGVIVKEGTTLEEIIPMMDYFTQLGEHIGFFVGDIMVFARNNYKERVDWAMEATGRASSTVKNFEGVARAVPIKDRSPKLTFSHHQALTRIEDKKAIAKLIKEAEPKENSKGVITKAALTVREFRDKVNKEYPPKPKKAKPMKDGKAKPAKPPKKNVEYYVPSAEEQIAIDGFFEVIKDPLQIIEQPLTKGGKHIGDIYVKMDHASKKGLCSVLKPFADLYNRVSFKMGYAG